MLNRNRKCELERSQTIDSPGKIEDDNAGEPFHNMPVADEFLGSIDDRSRWQEDLIELIYSEDQVREARSIRPTDFAVRSFLRSLEFLGIATRQEQISYIG